MRSTTTPTAKCKAAPPAPFGYTGELQQGSNVCLRARRYHAGSGSFGSRDPFEGMAETLYSLHYYAYGYSNPVGNTDPTGKFACATTIANSGKRFYAKQWQDYAAFCQESYDRANNWVNAGGTKHALGVLISLFSANGFPGGNSSRAMANRMSGLTLAAERLEFILDYLTNPLLGTPFRKTFNDTGFGTQFQDPWIGESDNQVGHFMTAVGLAYAPGEYVRDIRTHAGLSGLEPNGDRLSDDEVALRLIVGHEVTPDVAKREQWRLDKVLKSIQTQYSAATSESITFILINTFANLDSATFRRRYL